MASSILSYLIQRSITDNVFAVGRKGKDKKKKERKRIEKKRERHLPPRSYGHHWPVATPSLGRAFRGKSHKFSEKLSPEKLGFKHEKLTHLNFFFHDIVTGQNPTAVRVAEAAMTNTSKTLFGSVMIIDDPLTEGPEMESKLVGRAQGMYASAGQNEPGLLMAMTFHFVEGKFNGSNLSFLGRNSVFSEVRELPIVGGSGLFRFARGYAEARTRTLDMKTGNAVVEYNVYVFHY